MEPKDIVFHANITGAPFVLTKTKGKNLSEQTIKETAQFAASYSRAWKEKLSCIDVYWVRADQVNKSPPSGQYLRRGSFMISGNTNYVKDVPLIISLGLKKDVKRLKIIGGPHDAIVKQTAIYTNIVPGNNKSGFLAKEVKKKLANLASDDERKHILKIRLDEIQKFFPSGLGKIK
jgi:hypothetical protein